MLNFILALSLFIIIGLFFLKPSIGLPAFLVYYFLIPAIDIQIGHYSIGNSAVCFILFCSALILNLGEIKHINFRPYIPFLFLELFLFIIYIFGDAVPFIFSIKTFIAAFSKFILMPMSIYIMISGKPYILKNINGTMICIIAIIIGYGLFLLSMPGINPYVFYISKSMDTMDFSEFYANLGGGRAFGRISSVFMHPMEYGAFLGLSFFYLIFLAKVRGTKRVKLMFCLSLIFVSILTCGVRSSFAALIGAIFVYLFLCQI